MGLYIYTMRKKTRKIQGVDAHYFSFAYKPCLCHTRKWIYKKYDREAKEAFSDYDGGPVILADPGDNLNGARVYRNVRSREWCDCYDFPGDPIGFIKQEGRKLILVSEHRWKLSDRVCVDCIKEGEFVTRIETN